MCISVKSSAAFLMFVAANSHASNWVPLMNDSSGGMFVDTQSLRITGDIRVAWIKGTFGPTPLPAKDGKLMSYFLIKVAFNCAQESSKPEAMVRYFEDGSQENSGELKQTTWHPVPPDSTDEKQMKFVCSQAKP